MNSKIVERSIVHYTNKERGKRKLKKLKGHDALIHAARKHSNWMAQTKKFSHTGENGSSPSDRARAQGYPNEFVGENLFLLSGGKNASSWKLGKSAVSGWMKSDGHKANILNSDYHSLGVGIRRSSSNVYLTQKFGGGERGHLPLGLILNLALFVIVGVGIGWVCG